MNAFNFIIFVMFLWTLKNIILGILAWRQAKILRKAEQKEVTQRFFAEARNDLMRLLLNNEIAVCSTTFRFFYYLDTFVMRRPNNLKAISIILLNSLVFDEKSNSGVVEELMKERATWTENVKKMISRQSKALNHLMISHSFVLRNIYRISRTLLPVADLIISTMDFWEKTKQTIAEKDTGFVHHVYRSEKTLESLIAT